MTDRWTFSRKLLTGFSALAGLTLLTAVVSVWALDAVVDAKDEVIAGAASSLADSSKLETLAERRAAEGRGYLLDGKEEHREALETIRREFDHSLAQLERSAASAAMQRAVDQVRETDQAHRDAFNPLLELKEGGAKFEELIPRFDKETLPLREKFLDSLQTLRDTFSEHHEEQRLAATRTATLSMWIVSTLGAFSTAGGALLGVLLLRSLSRQVGATVQHMRSSSAELQAASTQQATSTKEQVTAIQEMTTTMKELLATSRQIGESARQVAEVARRAADSGRRGLSTVSTGQEAIEVVRRQVGVVVELMLDLGRKSGRIGEVVEIIGELSEQTNILSVNATIEAAGAERSGARFSAVAEEIRKLAERVGGSSREIRRLVDEVRSSVHSTVMATESGMKAADAATNQFGQVATAFGEIAALVENTSDAAREIEVSTRQQTTAVEQVNTAVLDVAQAARETEASTTQTLQTATSLASVSTELSRFVHATRDS